MEEIRKQLKRIHNQIVTALDREQMKAANIPDIKIAVTEEASIVLNNIDLLYDALRSVDNAEYALKDYEEVKSDESAE